MTDQQSKLFENKLRRAAKRQGLQLVKSRRRDPRASDYGTYMLVDVRTNYLVTEANMSIEQVADHLGTEANMTIEQVADHSDTMTYTYAQRWADAINETYSEIDDLLYGVLLPNIQEEGEDELAAIRRVLTKAAECLRNGVPATFTAAELDLVRHLMPAHEVHQSGTTRWVLDNYGRV